MFGIELAFPFTLGLVAAFNPCGFAMLPVYVSFFLGRDSDADTNMARNVLRALKVGLALTAGFVAVFGLFGLITATILSQGSILDWAPYVTIVLGVLFVPLGLAMIGGFELKVGGPRLQKGGGSRELRSMFMFGVSYAVVSLGCTVPLFVGAIIGTFTSDGFGSGVMQLIAYALGMGAVIMTLTLGLAMARTGIATNMRKMLPWVNRISGVLMVLAGIYLVIYGWWEVQVLRGNITDNRLVGFFENFQNEVSAWISQTGAPRLGIALLLIVGLALLRGLWGSLPQAGRIVGAALIGAGWIVAEFIRSWNDERPNLFVLPIIRTIASIPERIGNWFTDPLRWGVLGEVLVVAIIGLVLWFRFRPTAGDESVDETGTDVPAGDPAPVTA